MTQEIEKEMTPAFEFTNSEVIESGVLLQEFIQPHDSVVVVGPNVTMVHDPSLLYVCHIVGEDGVVYVADPGVGAQ